MDFEWVLAEGTSIAVGEFNSNEKDVDVSSLARNRKEYCRSMQKVENQ